MKKLLVILSTVAATLAYAQIPPQIAKRTISWADRTPSSDLTTHAEANFIGFNTPQSQLQSAEDWWYDTKPVYVGGVQTGWVAVGFTRYLNLTFTEQTLSPKGLLSGGAGGASSTADDRCNQRLLPGQLLSGYKSCMALFTLEGDVVWFKALYTGGALNAVQQTPDGGFIAIGDCRAGYNVFGTQYVYNPSATNTAGLFTQIYAIGTAGSGITDPSYYAADRVAVVKTDANGNPVWNYMYGQADLTGTQAQNSTTFRNTQGYGVDIANNPNGGYTLLGSVVDNKFTPTLRYPLVINVDDDGKVITRQGYHTVNGTAVGINSQNLSCTGGVCAVGGGCDGPIGGSYLLKINQSNLSLATGMTSNPANYHPGSTLNYRLDALYLETDGSVYGATLKGASLGGGSSWGNVGDAYAVRFNPNGTLSNEVALGTVTAYDLRMGITKSSDGNYVIVSTKRQKINGVEYTPHNNDADVLDVMNNYNQQLLSPPYCSGDDLGVQFIWNTDTYVAKINSSCSILWQKQFDSDDKARMYHPGDFKKQECMYNVAAGQDGSLFVVGNSSHNLDDFFAAKLFSDCQPNYVYNIFDNVDNVYDIIGTTTWAQNKTVKGVVKVKNGATLNITNITVEFADTRRIGIRTGIVVEPGGRLILNGATLTSIQGCGEKAMWDGIEVQGSPTLPQSPSSNQGYVSCTNSYITDARNGMSTTAINTDGSTNFYLTGGGIIQVTTSHFVNNWRAVEFRAFVPKNGAGTIINEASRITRTTFEVNDSYGDGASKKTSFAQITMNATRFVQLSGLTFTDYRTSLPYDSRFSGIYAIDAAFNVTEFCTSGNYPCSGPIISTTFNNLYHGVYVNSGSTNAPVTVSKCSFVNNMYGVRIEGAHYGSVLQCSFNVPKLVPGTLPMGIGVYSSASYGFRIEENGFTSAASSDPNAQSMGVYINNSNVAAGGMKDYRNDFTGFTIATQVAGNNNSLQIDCNRFYKSTSGKVDIHIPNGVLGTQGICSTTDPTAAMANEFSGTCNTSPLQQIANFGSALIYNSYAFTGLSTACKSGLVTENFCTGTYARETACPSNFNDGIVMRSVGTLRLESKNYAALLAHSASDRKTASSTQNEEEQHTLNYLRTQKQLIDDEIVATYLASNQPDSARQHLSQQADVASLVQLLGMSGDLSTNAYNQLANATIAKLNADPTDDLALKNQLLAQVEYFKWRKQHAADVYADAPVTVADLNVNAAEYPELVSLAQSLNYMRNGKIEPAQVYPLLDGNATANEAGINTATRSRARLFPNPSDGKVNIEIPAGASLQSVQGFSLDGRILYEENNMRSATTHSFFVNPEYHGLLIVKLTYMDERSNLQTEVQKIVIH